MASIDAAITDHLKVFFRDMPNQSFDKVYGWDGLYDVLFIFMPIVMKSNHFTIVFINTGCGNNWTTEIATDIFHYGFWIAMIGFGIHIKALFVIGITFGFYFFERGTDFGFHFIKQSGTESISQIVVMKVGDVAPKPVITITAFGNQTMNMRIPFKVSAESVKNHNKARCEIFGFIDLEKHAGDDTGNSMKKAVKKRTVVKEERAEVFINGKNTVPMLYIDEFE